MRLSQVGWILLLLFSSNLGFVELANPSSRTLAQLPSPRKSEADRLLNSAVNSLRINALALAKQQLEQALQLYRLLADAKGQRDAYTNLSLLNHRQGRYAEALQSLQQAEKFPGDFQQQGQTLSLRGMIQVELGNYRNALLTLQQAQGRQLRDVAAENRTRIALAETYHYLGWYSKALPYLEMARRTPGDRFDLGWTFQVLGDVHFNLGQFEQALEHYQQALSIRQAVGDRRGTARTLNSLGQVYRVLGQPEALQVYQQALSVMNGLGDQAGRVYALNSLGVASLDLNQKAQALDYFQQALGTTRLAGNAGRVLTLTNLGHYYRQLQEYRRALDFYEQALAWARKTGDRIGEAKALSALGETLLESGQLEQAVPTLQSSLAIFEGLRPGLRDEQKVALFETQTYTYELLQKALVSQNRFAEALVAAERGRARAFVELLAQRLSSSSQLAENWAAPPTVPSLKATAQKLQATLVSYSILRDSTGQETALYIWVMNAAGDISFRQLDLKTLTIQGLSLSNLAQQARIAAATGRERQRPILTNWVTLLRGAMAASDLPIQKSLILSSIRNGYELLIQPLADLLPADPQARLILIPQGALFLVPFQALQDANGRFLIEKHTLLFAPSIQALSLTPVRSGTSQAALVVGNPVPMPLQLSPLPAAEEEARAIAQLLRTPALIGAKATETQVVQRMTRAAIIHLATHGLLDDQQGLNSSLAFVADRQQDGLLTAAEILELKLQANLAVLSACDTGRGKITGDGVIGLARSLMSAGVPSVVVSLWSVPDAPTAQLMIEFYRQLQQQKLDKAQALRQAMLTMMRQDPNPRNWAGFVLIGQAN